MYMAAAEKGKAGRKGSMAAGKPGRATFAKSDEKSRERYGRQNDRKQDLRPGRNVSRDNWQSDKRQSDKRQPADAKYARDMAGGKWRTASAKAARDTISEKRRSADDKAARDAAWNEMQPADELDRLEGRNSVLEALRSDRSINRILIARGEREGSINQIIALARQKHIVIQETDRAKLDVMSETHSHQGVIALVSARDYVEVDDILKAAADSGKPPFIVILDEITDPHNLGSILRTSNAAGVHGVIIPKRRAIGLTSVVSKASAGAIEYVPVARVTNIVQTIEYLKKQNIWVAGTDSEGDRPYYDCDLTGGIALVIGSEGEGMGKLVREACDFTVSIPMAGEISSLNAAVAGAIVIYEIVRQRNKKPQ